MTNIKPNKEVIVEAMIEIPKGSSNKYEFDHEKNVIKLDRCLFSPMFYPADYGFVPETLSEDGDPIDILVLMKNPTFPGCMIESRIIGMFKMADDKGNDEKLIAVPIHDPRYDEVYSLGDLSSHTEREFEHFFKEYKRLENKKVEIGGWYNVADAIKALEKSREAYKKINNK
ncbi:inorganic diphosphatase [Miniphocaeibacter halophilus]|uniref:Inorganic diphosphatase n=1 Tax=Miniphocaeibacter halophilus TaxID=2931922 RepID=A0AC61MSN4_9FIRM|nr:inorganic diphosphatase [Miniphocaeibacter halophilus]QQK07471.1 inorganic diphosphatase [Miniphocaeibacter halophilus]